MKPRNELNLHFTTDVRTLDAWCLELDSGVTAEVFGDPDNASYEWRLVHDDGLVEQHSDCGYGIPAIAMRDALVAYYGTPQSGGDTVDLRKDNERDSKQLVNAPEGITTISAGWVDAADKELDSLRSDADRYRILRERWLRIEGESTVHREAGLDLWCDNFLKLRKPPAS